MSFDMRSEAMVSEGNRAVASLADVVATSKTYRLAAERASGDRIGGQPAAA